MHTMVHSSSMRRMGYPAKMPNEDKRQEMTKDQRQLVGNVCRIKIQSFHMRTQIQEDIVTNNQKEIHAQHGHDKLTQHRKKGNHKK